MSNYSTPATGRLWAPGDENGDIKHEEAIEQVRNSGGSEAVVDSQNDRVVVDEIAYSDGSLKLRVLFGEWFVSFDAPLRPNNDLRNLLRDINRSFDVASRESGYYLSNTDVDFVDTFKPDGQGRITLGREYADKDVKVIGVVEDG